MELDNIKLQTTWNDAAGSINNNFAKIKLALASYVVEGGGLDEEQLLEYLVNNGYVTQEWINENGYIKEVTKKMIADSLGSKDNAGKFLMSIGGDVVWAEVDTKQDTPDWDAAQGAAGYIANRPFYATWYYKKDHFSVSASSPITLSSAVQIEATDFMSADVYHQGKRYVCQGRFDYISGILTFEIGSGKTISFEKYQSSLNIRTTDTSNVTIELIKTASNIVKLDEIYIPSAIARKTYVDTKAAEAQAAAEKYIQDEVLTNYATTKYVGEREEYLVGYAEGLVNDLEKEINSRGYLTSAAMNGYATKDDIKNFVTKGTTLAHYGITDAVISRLGIEPYESGVGNRMGYSYRSKGWNVDGAAMVWGLPYLNVRLNADIGSGDNPGLYLSIYNNGTAYQWAQVVTDKNFTQFGVKAGRRYTGAYDDDPKSANDIDYPSMAGFTSHLADVPFQNGNLLTITTNPNLYVGQIAISSGGLISFRSRTETTWTDWQTILHTGNIGKVALTSLNLNGTTITSWDEIAGSGGGGNYLPLTGGTIDGSLTINGGFKVQSVHGHYINFDGFSLTANAGLKVASGYSLSLAGEGITAWAGLKTYLGLGSLAYKDSVAFSDISDKPTTLSGYGITDAVKAGLRFDSIQTGTVNILGWVEEANNWKGQGAGMLIGQPNYYTRVNITGTNDDPTMYLSRIYAGTAYDWVKVLTEKNIGRHSIEIVKASTYPLPTDTRAFTTYAYQRDGWVNTGPALAFPDGAYKGLVQMTYGPDNTYMRMFVGGVRPEVEGKILPWTEVLTAANIGSMAMSVGPIYWGNIDFNELTTPGSYVVAGTGNTNNPANNCTVLTITGNYRYLSSQVVVDINGQLYTRGKPEGDWREWKTYLDVASADAKYLKLAGGQLTGGVTFNGNVAFKGGIFFYNNLSIETGNGITLGGETINSWADVRSNWGSSLSSVTNANMTIEVVPRVKKEILTTLNDSHTVTFNLTVPANTDIEWIIVFKTGSTVPRINIYHPNATLTWQDKENILNKLSPNTTYRIHIDHYLAMYETF